MTPSWRKPAGMLGILLLITLWCVAIVSLSTIVGSWHWLGQLGVEFSQRLFAGE